MLEIRQLNLYLGKKHVLNNITLSIPICGEIIGIMGPNGAGKSSLIKSLIGEFNATGTKLLYGKPIQQQLDYITYIPQKAHIDLDFPINVEQVILSGCYKDIGWFTKPTINNRQKLEQLIDELELRPLKRRQISELSGGQLQRVLVARALMSESEVYFLDEPFVGIDFNSEALIMKKINQLKNLGKLILIVHHDLSKAEQYFDRILLLNRTIRFFGLSEEAMTIERLNETFMSSTDYLDNSQRSDATC
ncbi:metal ABC transporter ATP-binding protein [Staphylococcus simiae]|uniref:metal ABC transporter ATP-binding protein n=1 Tax=Staphylococcus simiae TaxID=308354 RepID=UPI001A965BC4|nr:metal ABC transporter ATP-binding protein [Staphylococcus simiae]MBO1198810.1 metal ABC transporter ATP-binding protein [Staphylococcus simiae]MBO1201007.1 metal ABC transporter ATP-binding protein [Staphylococcus simiae]MBO1203823.1 metal ABC transporter ATP-binding protein [Staphylococcus simiae]MBO1212046.1 metal ABC transporter ATP-binding protein [Staphylococcus simiae]MBO1229400.1 metal ABC transporter ATP-binding protein [Staphylococcus simiae]